MIDPRTTNCLDLSLSSVCNGGGGYPKTVSNDMDGLSDHSEKIERESVVGR